MNRRIGPPCGSERQKELIVSMTSHPARINNVALVVETIYKQTQLPDKVILWLGESQFPGKYADLPKELVKLATDKKLDIRWCDDADLKPHTKYYYAFKEYPDALIITVDDDILYHPKLIENLYSSYLLHPNAVSAACVNLIPVLSSGEILPYVSWPVEVDAVLSKPSMQFMALGVGGVLYPTILFLQGKELLDKELIKNSCPYNDDLWLKAMEMISDIPVVVSEKFHPLRYIPGSQDVGLWHENMGNGRTDSELDQIRKEIDRRYGEKTFYKKLTDSSAGENLIGERSLYELINLYKKEANKQAAQTKKHYEKKLGLTQRKVNKLEKENRKYLDELKRIKSGWSFRIGRVITFFPRIIKDMLK